MKIMIIGSGGREHAFAWKIKQSPLCKQMHYCSGRANPGIDALEASFVDIALSRNDLIVAKARALDIGLVVVGPETPLANGLADALARAKILCFGPTQAAVWLESSKAKANKFMDTYGILTAPWATFEDVNKAQKHIRQKYPNGVCVVKADGLCAGKGVFVCASFDESVAAVDRIMVRGAFGSAGDRVVIEDKLIGGEVSIFAITDGKHIVVLPPAQGHKRIGEGDTGANTGGMGAYSPVPMVTDELLEEIVQTILQPTIDGMAREGCPYQGVLNASLMIVKGKPHVIEFNCRFGDPEAQVVLPVIEEDILPLLIAAAQGNLPENRVIKASRHALCVVVASGGYPENYEQGYRIDGLEKVNNFFYNERKKLTQGVVFHAGTAYGDENGKLVTAGGRVVGVTAFFNTDLKEARVNANLAAGFVKFKDSFSRRDIGHNALTPSMKELIISEGLRLLSKK